MQNQAVNTIANLTMIRQAMRKSRHKTQALVIVVNCACVIPPPAPYLKSRIVIHIFFRDSEPLLPACMIFARCAGRK